MSSTNANLDAGDTVQLSSILQLPVVQTPSATLFVPPQINITHARSSSNEPSTPPRLPSPVALRPTYDNHWLPTEPTASPSRPFLILPSSTPIPLASSPDIGGHQSVTKDWCDSAPDSRYTARDIGGNEWRQYTHPNGSLYWVSPSNAVVSDEEPDTETTLPLEPHLQNIRAENDPEQWELYFAADSFRFVHHESRSVSAPSEMVPFFKARIEQAASDIMTKLELEHNYWTYVQGHPNHTRMPQGAKYDAEEAILWSHADRSIFDSSNAPFEKEVAKEMLTILREFDGLPRLTLKVWFVAAVMRVVVGERKACLYGTHQARQVRYLEKAEDVAAIHDFNSVLNALVWRVITTITLGVPFSYLKRIFNVDRSNGISTTRWRAFLKNICAEWVDTNLLSTVLVSAITSMLALSATNPLAQVAAFCSILSSLGSILCGMLLIFTHRGRMESTGHAAYLYFDYAKQLTGSPHSLAVLLSLPVCLTLWAIFWFVLSVASLAFKPSIPLLPVIWGLLLRYGTIVLVGCLVLVVATVGWFFRSRQGSAIMHFQQHVLTPQRHFSYSTPISSPPTVGATTPSFLSPMGTVNSSARMGSMAVPATFRPQSM